MKISHTTEYIRQQQLGQFRRPEDGKKPFTHVNDQKLDSIKERKESSVYIDNKNIQTLEKGLGSSSPKLFDYDPGMKFNIEKSNEISKEEKISKQYDNTGKEEEVNEKESLVDQWV